MGAVKLAVDNPVEQHFPVGLGFQGDVQPLIFEKAFFIGNGKRRHVGQLDKAELKIFLFQFQFFRLQWRAHHAGCGSPNY